MHTFPGPGDRRAGLDTNPRSSVAPLPVHLPGHAPECASTLLIGGHFLAADHDAYSREDVLRFALKV